MPEMIENRMVCESDYHIRKVICRCNQCSGEIYEQDDFYDFDGEIVCKGCIDSHINDYLSEHRRCEYGREE